jgi:23S rRNA (uracil1939-C5)-methyltransferase
VAAGDDAVALVFRHLTPLSDQDRDHLTRFAREHDVGMRLQAGGPDSVQPLWPAEAPDLYYEVDDGVRIHFEPTDFIQVNGAQNRKLVELALTLLEPGPRDAVLDLFCGLGNFSLPIAKRAGRVLGVEGERRLTERAAANARSNGIDNTEFMTADLYSGTLSGRWIDASFDKMLVDPPRSGAMEVMKRVPDISPRRIVYVSCNTATLARDSELLVRKQGYRLRLAGIVDMFPHTAHVESIALFDRD